MIAPPKPSADELELLIKEARDRQRRRRILAASVVALLTGVALGIYAVFGGLGQKGVTAGGPGASAPPCRSSQLASSPIAFLGFGTAIGNIGEAGGLSFKNTGSHACALPLSPPRVFAYFGGQRLALKQLPADRSVPNSRGPVARVLAPGKSAYTSLRWSNWCGPPRRSVSTNTRAVHVTLRYVLRGLVFRETGATPNCVSAGRPSTILVSRLLLARD